MGKNVGLGGVRLWDGKKVVMLNPVSMRTARVSRKEDSSVMEMISAGVPYKDRKVDILVRVTVKSGVRFSAVEAEVLSGGPVQFITGINYHPGLEILRKRGRIARDTSGRGWACQGAGRKWETTTVSVRNQESWCPVCEMEVGLREDG